MTTFIFWLGVLLVWAGLAVRDGDGPEMAKCGVWLIAVSYAAFWLMYGRPYLPPQPERAAPLARAAAWFAGLR